MKTYDLALVCGRRPELVTRTLDSFNQYVFHHFTFANVLVNIDPFCGNSRDGDEVRKIIKSYFPEAIIFEPSSPSFGSAVQRLWKNSKSDILLHLEDDWIALEEIRAEKVEQYLVDDVASLSIMVKEKNWDGTSRYHTSIRKTKVFGIPVWQEEINIFSTSPCFLRGDFARKCAELMNPSLDPEKQFYQRINKPLEQYALKYKNRLLPGVKSQNILQDIGREWRERMNIHKVISNGTSTWAKENT